MFFESKINKDPDQRNYIVSNKKIKHAINKQLPINAKDGFIKTLNSFGKTVPTSFFII